MTTLTDLHEVLPFLVPLMIVEFSLFGYVIWHILTHNHYKRGSRMLWMIICIIGMNFVGPILYLLLGKEEA